MDFDVSPSAAEDLSVSPMSSVSGLFRRSLQASVSCRGVGIHNGLDVMMRLVPLDSGSGIIFRRLDIEGDSAYIPANYENVYDTQCCTRLRNDSGVVVSTVEHICSALYGLGISDILIELDGEEVPIMDGSCRDFVDMIHSVGIVNFSEQREVLRVLHDVEVFHDDGRSCRLEVSDESLFSFDLDYGSSMLRQSYSFSMNDNNFASDICSARTFGRVAELEILRAKGLALGADYSNVIALGCDGVINESGLRYDDELVRHKILDAMGDLCLSGYPILGHFVGDRSGHGLNNKLLRKLFSDKKNYSIDLI